MIRRNKSVIGGIFIGERHWIDVNQSGMNEIVNFVSSITLGQFSASVLALTDTFASPLTLTSEQGSVVF